MSEAPKFKKLFFSHFSDFQISLVLTIFLYRMDSLLLIYDMMIFSLSDIYPVSGFFPDFSGFSPNLQISSQNGGFTSHDMMIFFSGNLSGFRFMF